MQIQKYIAHKIHDVWHPVWNDMHLKTQENTAYDKKVNWWNRPRNDTVIESVDKDIDRFIITVLLMVR